MGRKDKPNRWKEIGNSDAIEIKSKMELSKKET